MHAIERILSLGGTVRAAGSYFGLLLLLGQLELNSQDWQGWLGPNGNNQVQANPSFDPDIENWTLAWQAEVGSGYSSSIVLDDKVYTMGSDGKDQETVYCLNLSDGQNSWIFTYPAALMPKAHRGGPNASVTIVENKLYALSKDGQFHCLNRLTGSLKWKVNLTELLEMEIPRWGFACSPIAYRGNLLISAGKLVALDQENVFYGLNGLPEETKTTLFCRNLDDGSLNWSVPEFGYGSLIRINETLLVLTEDGELVTALADRSRFRELSRKKLLDSICWTAPTFAHGKIFLRNDLGDLICLIQSLS